MEWATWLMAGGLLLDIAGVVFFAIPETPRVRDRFKVGKLRKGRELLESGGISPGDPGYKQIKSVIADVYDFRPDQSVHEIRISRLWKVGEGIVIDYGDQPNSEARDTIEEMGTVYQRLIEELDAAEARFRIPGFVLLAGGFSLQLISVFL